MRSISDNSSSIFLCLVMLVLTPKISVQAQEKEKAKPGTTIDAWRMALPSDSGAQGPGEEMAVVDSASPTGSEERQRLLALERSWMDSLKLRDVDSLSQIIALDFTFASPRMAEVKDRGQYLAYAVGELKLTSYEIDKMTVRLFGRTAIVSAHFKQKASVAGEDWSGNYLVTSVWLNRNGTWRVVNRHESLLQKQ